MFNSFHIYHLSAKMILPLFMTNVLFRKYEVNNNLIVLTDSLHISNIIYHSYVSTNFVITDYIVHKKMQSFIRFASFSSHTISAIAALSCVQYLYYESNQNRPLDLKYYNP